MKSDNQPVFLAVHLRRLIPAVASLGLALLILALPSIAPDVAAEEDCDKHCCLAAGVVDSVWRFEMDYYQCWCINNEPMGETSFRRRVAFEFDVFSYTYACGEEWECTQVSTDPKATIRCGDTEQMLFPRLGENWRRAYGPKSQAICEECYIPGQCFPLMPNWADLPKMCGICVCDDPCHCHVEWLSPLVDCSLK
ncbi:MAG: hypothetical protein GEEBNDBF_01374 [bacterium]|nr:hypothetical protein [bacterium]